MQKFGAAFRVEFISNAMSEKEAGQSMTRLLFACFHFVSFIWKQNGNTRADTASVIISKITLSKNKNLLHNKKNFTGEGVLAFAAEELRDELF